VNNVKKYKLGKCQKTGQDHARIWIENKRLPEVGFTPNSHYAIEWIAEDPSLKLWLLDDDDIASEVRKVTDKKGSSVIDLTGWEIKQFFDGHTHYTLKYEAGCITIKGASE
jgi:hypothetical protein